MLAALLLPLASAFLPSSRQPACDKSRGSKEVCASFCAGECAFYNASAETGSPRNLTLYRLTPANVTGLRNKDSGDMVGDVNFFLMRRNLSLGCDAHPNQWGCFLSGDDVYGQFSVEVDGLYGPYQECNPALVVGPGGYDPYRPSGWFDTRSFRCGQNCMLPTEAKGCEDPTTRWGPEKNGSGWSSYNCYCDGTHRDARTVGRETSPPGHYRPGAHAGWPPQCQDVFRPPVLGCLSGATLKQLPAWSFESAAAAACDSCYEDERCTGWAIAQDNRSATLFRGELSLKPLRKCVSAAHKGDRWGGGGRSWFGIGVGEGHWYSTPIAGECAEGAALGTDGCKWRQLGAIKYANASCVDRHVDAFLEASGRACFERCGAPLNRSSECYMECYFNTLVGDPALNLSAAQPKELAAIWHRGFEEEDPARGGCPSVQPRRCVGPQCE